MKLSREEFKQYLADNAQYLMFEHVDKIHEMFDQFVENDTIEEYVYEFDPSTNALKISFTFENGESIDIQIGG